MGYKVEEKLKRSGELSAEIKTLDYKIKAGPRDTEVAAKIMEAEALGCVVILGGDGTHRLAAKHLKNVPIIGVSTGTNNAYPKLLEGTVVGMAAAAIASEKEIYKSSYERDKIIEIKKNGSYVDLALVDVVISDAVVIGSKAIWDLENIKEIIVSKAHPASIGFSSLIGVNKIITEKDAYGARLVINQGKNKFYAPLAAGKIVKVISQDVEEIPLGEVIHWKASYKGVIAVDGEREISFKKGDALSLVMNRNGPLHVDVEKALEVALKDGFYLIE
jgi:predicted polyphosphate/ATP-dependent NAD kinase